MGWDGAGGYTRQHNFSADASAGVKILAVRMDQEIDDFASAIQLAWARDGQNVPTADMPMGGRKFVNVGAPTSVSNFMRVREFIENVPIFMQDAESSADRISVSSQYFTSVSANQAPVDGTKIMVRVASNKSSAVLYLDGHSANVEYQDGNRIGPALVSGGIYEFTYSSADTSWRVATPDDGRTAAEIAAGVTPTNYQHEPHKLRRQGAVGDNSTDDGSAVRNSLLASKADSAISDAEDGFTYLCTTFTTVDTTDNVKLRGASTIKGPASYTDFCRPGGEVAIYDVAFDRWLSVLERELAETGSVTRLDVEGCVLSDINSVAFNIERPLSNYRWMWNEFSNTNGGYTIRVGTNDDDEQDTWKDGVIAFNRWNDVNGSSTASTAAVITYGRDTLVLGNTVHDVDQTGTGEGWAFYGKIRHGIWAFNIVGDIQAAGSTDNTGISIKGAHRGETGAGPQSYGNLVIGHIAYDIGVDGTRGIGVRLQSEEVYASFCYVYDPGLSGVTIDDDGEGHVGSFFNRIGFTATPDSATAGVRLSNSGSGVRSIGDEIWGTPGLGVRIDGGADGADSVVVAHAVITAAQAFSINTSTAIDGLSLINNVVPSATFGLVFASAASSSNVTRFRFLDNDLDGAGTQFSGAIPGDCEVRHSWKFQTTAAGPTTALTIPLADEASYAIELRAVATLNDGAEQNLYHIEGLWFRNGGGGATIVGAVQDIITAQEVTAAWDATLTASGNNVLVRLTGEASHTINWKLWIHVLGASAA